MSSLRWPSRLTIGYQQFKISFILYGQRFCVEKSFYVPRFLHKQVSERMKIGYEKKTKLHNSVSWRRQLGVTCCQWSRSFVLWIFSIGIEQKFYLAFALKSFFIPWWSGYFFESAKEYRWLTCIVLFLTESLLKLRTPITVMSRTRANKSLLAWHLSIWKKISIHWIIEQDLFTCLSVLNKTNGSTSSS